MADWICGTDAEEQEYLVHAAYPRFIARIGIDEFSPEGLTLALHGGETLYDIQWIDPLPDTTTAYLLRLIDQASAGLAAFDREDPAHGV